MVYTLLGAATLGFDLVRIEGGRRVAQVLLVALNVTEADLPRLAGAHPGSGRQLRWHETVAAAGASASVTDATIDLTTDRQALTHPPTAHLLLRRLERSRLGDLAALDRMIRTDILDWTWTWATGADTTHRQAAAGHQDRVATQDQNASRAADVLVDAVAAAYAAEVLPADVRYELERPLQAILAAGNPAESSDLPGATIEVLAQLRDLDANQRSSLRAAAGPRHRAANWAPAMHEASWATHLGGRTRVAAEAQLRATLAFGEAGFDARDGAQGVWNAVAGVVADSIVRDMLPDDVREVLRAPWRLLDGPTSAG